MSQGCWALEGFLRSGVGPHATALLVACHLGSCRGQHWADLREDKQINYKKINLRSPKVSPEHLVRFSLVRSCCACFLDPPRSARALCPPRPQGILEVLMCLWPLARNEPPVSVRFNPLLPSFLPSSVVVGLDPQNLVLRTNFSMRWVSPNSNGAVWNPGLLGKTLAPYHRRADLSTSKPRETGDQF